MCIHLVWHTAADPAHTRLETDATGSVDCPSSPFADILTRNIPCQEPLHMSGDQHVTCQSLHQKLVLGVMASWDPPAVSAGCAAASLGCAPACTAAAPAGAAAAAAEATAAVP